jgi:hypothetical protein
MSAFIQAVHALVFALASAAFAHFGVALKESPRPRAEQSVHRAAVTTAAPAPKTRATPCLLGIRVDRA